MRGYTLLEVFIVCMLLSIMLFALIGMYPSAMASARKGAHMVAASDLAQESIDSALAAPSPGVTTTKSTVDGVEYTVFRSVVALSPKIGIRDTFEITADVRWQAGDGVSASSVHFQTLQYDFVNPH